MSFQAREAPPRRVGAYSWYVLGVLVIVYALSMIDRQILSILAEDIKRDLFLTDAQLGFLYGTAFAIFYTVFGIPLGRLADNWRRGTLIALGLALWSAMTLASGLAHSYSGLAAARVGVGIGEASAAPAAYSMLASLFPKERRAFAIAIFSIGAYLGIGLSLPVGGWIANSWDRWFAAGDSLLGLHGWQAAFIAVGLPGPLVAAWVYSLREPVRYTESGEARHAVMAGVWRSFFIDVSAVLPPFTLLNVARFRGELVRNLAGAALIGAAAAGIIRLTGDIGQWTAYGVGVYAIFSWSQSLRHTDPPAYRLIWGSWTIPLALIGFGSITLVLYSFTFWAPPYAIRTYGVSASVVGSLIGVPGAIASCIGVVLGGRLSDVWKRRDPRGRIFTCMVSAAAPVPLIVIAFTRSNLQTYLLLTPAIYFFCTMYTASAAAAYQDFVLPRMYGLAGALFVLGSTMIGLALGPYSTGKIATITGSLRMGVFSMLAAPVVALFVLWLLSRRAADAEATKLARAIEAGEPVGVD
jgi:MFS family permease